MKHAIKSVTITSIALIILISLVLSLPAQVQAAPGDSTSIGNLDLESTATCISVISYFSGDNNRNNQATLYYRKSGSSSWLQGIDMT